MIAIWQKIKEWFWGNQSPKSDNTQTTYEVVERQLGEDQFRQGIRILHGKYNKVVVTISPKVSVDTNEDGSVGLTFDFTVEYAPPGLVVLKSELHPIIGDCIVDIITKDFVNENRSTDSECSGQ